MFEVHRGHGEEEAEEEAEEEICYRSGSDRAHILGNFFQRPSVQESAMPQNSCQRRATSFHYPCMYVDYCRIYNKAVRGSSE